MLGTLFSLFFVAWMWMAQGQGWMGDTNSIVFPVVQIVAGGVILVAAALLNTLMWIPLQRLENNLVPRLGENLSKSWSWRGKQILLLLFVLFSFASVIDTGLSKKWLMSGWVLFLGVALDALFASWGQLGKALSPFAAIASIGQTGLRAIKAKQTTAVCAQVDALTEVVLKAIDEDNLAVGDAALREMEGIARGAVTAYTGPQVERTEQIYVLSYTFQRFQLLHGRALKAHLEPFASFLIAALGKIALLAAAHDTALAGLSLHFLGECAGDAQRQGMDEVVVKSTLTLREVAKEALEEPQILQLGLKDLFLNVISQLEKIAKTTFKQDKSTNLTILTQPFRDLKTLLSEGKQASHPDADIIIRDLTRVLSEFQELEVILKTVPNIPGYSEEALTKENG